MSPRGDRELGIGRKDRARTVHYTWVCLREIINRVMRFPKGKNEEKDEKRVRGGLLENSILGALVEFKKWW